MVETKPVVIGVLSGKGGVGKSVTSVNLAALFSKFGKSSVLLDGDLANPTVGLHLGLSYANVSLNECLLGKHKASEAVVIQPQTGIRVLPASLKYKREGSLKQLQKVIEDLKGYEYIIIDSPPGLTEDAWEIMAVCDYVILVTTPDIPSVTASAKTLQICKEHKAKPIGIVINRVTKARYELTPREISSMVESPVLVEIPEDSSVPASIAARIPLSLYKPASPAARKLFMLAKSVSGGEGFTEPEQGNSFVSKFFYWLKSLFR